jgi:hypothetical protein
MATSAMKPVITLIAVLFLFSLSARIVYACDCDGPNQRNAFRKAVAVFVGQVTEINYRGAYDKNEAIHKRIHLFAVKFKVENFWKGATAKEIVVLSAQSGHPCALFQFEIGKRYLVYAETGDLIAKTYCSRTGPVLDPEVSKDLKKLVKGKVPS